MTDVQRQPVRDLRLSEFSRTPADLSPVVPEVVVGPDGGLLVRAGGLEVQVATGRVRLSFRRRGGRAVLEETLHGPVGFDDGSLCGGAGARIRFPTPEGAEGGATPVPFWVHLGRLEDWRLDGTTVVITAAIEGHANLKGTLRLGLRPPHSVDVEVEVPDPTAERTGTSFGVGVAERFFGLGELFGPIELRGQRRTMTSTDEGSRPTDSRETYYPVPLLLSTGGWGVLVDGYLPSDFDVAATRHDAVAFTSPGNRLVYHVFLSDEPIELLTAYATITGFPPKTAKWAFGIWKNLAAGDELGKAEVLLMRDLGVPVDAVMLGNLCAREYNIGWEGTGSYPSSPHGPLRGIVDWMHERRLKVIVYFNPYVRDGSDLYEEGVRNDAYLKRADGSIAKGGFWYYRRVDDPFPEWCPESMGLVDFTRPSGAAWWRDQVIRRLLTEANLDGWMQDFGESTFIPEDAMLDDGTSAREACNLLIVGYHKASFEGGEKYRGLDWVEHNRAGFAGAQGWSTNTWPGDQHSDWTWDRGLPSSVSAGITAGLSGVPFWGPQAEGYFDDSTSRDLHLDLELWMRWWQWGALTPRLYDSPGINTVVPMNCLSNETTIAQFVAYARLHSSLVPYLYSYAMESTRTCAPILRHLWFSHPDDPVAIDTHYQYTLGRELLVAPVVSPGVTEASVYLPAGGWIDWWTGDCYAGGQRVTVAAPPERIPLFVRVGSILPLRPEDELQATDEEARLDVAVWPGPAGSGWSASFTLFDGTTFRAAEEASGEVRVEVDGGAIRTYGLLVVGASTGEAASLDGAAAPAVASGSVVLSSGPAARLELVGRQVTARFRVAS